MYLKRKNVIMKLKVQDFIVTFMVFYLTDESGKGNIIFLIDIKNHFEGSG